MSQHNYKRIYFILALHSHQPVGNLPEVFDSTYEQAYRPFIEVLKQFPRIKVVLHYSGILLRWMAENRPEFIEELRSLVARGQVEIMGGGFYEPILPIIPDSDKIGQIEKLSQYIREIFGTEARGMWLAERIWEPHLAKSIAAAGLKYVVVDDDHFKQVGFKGKDLLYYYLTEEEGIGLNVFPISEKLRYFIPFKPPSQSIDYLRSWADAGDDRVLVLADDGEKFGSWPGTYGAVYEQKWLANFFNLIEENQQWLKMVTFSEYLRLFPPKGLVYLPTAAYREMREWSGGFWRNFLVRYPESNRMHKKMLAIRRELEEVKDNEVREKALDALWAGQCNCAYWHGIFGGLYLNFLRSAIYEKLIEAENIVKEERYGRKPWVEVKVEDRDYDGQKELVINSDQFALLFSPHRGGSLWELSFRPRRVNLLDTLTRQEEKYHRDLINAKKDTGEGVKTIHDGIRVKENGLQKYIIYDPYPRGALIDHFFAPGTTLEAFMSDSFREEGDFLMQPYTADFNKEVDRVIMAFRRRGSLGDGEIILTKHVSLQAGSGVIEVVYEFENISGIQLSPWFGVEFNLSFLAGDAPDRYYFIPGREIDEPHLASRGTESDVPEVGLRDHWRDVEVRFIFSQPASLWRFPIQTVSNSEQGIERVYQQSLILPHWRFVMSPGEKAVLEINVEIGTVEKGGKL